MPFEQATEEVSSGGLALNFDFDSAYWMSELTPANESNVATFDGRSLAIPEEPYIVAPDTDAPTEVGTAGPFVTAGLQWLDNPISTAPAGTNGLDIDLTGASAVRLDVVEMGIDPTQPIDGNVSTTHPLELRLDMGDGVTYTMNFEPGSHGFTVLPGTPTSN